MIPGKPGGFPFLFPAYRNRRLVDPHPLFDTIPDKQAVLPVAVTGPAAKQKRKGKIFSVHHFPAQCKTVGRISATVIEPYSPKGINMICPPRLTYFHIEKKHICLGVFFKFPDNFLRIIIFIDNILVGKQTDIPVRPQQSIVPAQPHPFFPQGIDSDPVPFPFDFLIPEMTTLIDQNPIAADIHFFCQLCRILVHGRNKQLQFHLFISVHSFCQTRQSTAGTVPDLPR